MTERVCDEGTIGALVEEHNEVIGIAADALAEVKRLRAIIDEATQVYGNALPCGNVCAHFDCRALHVLRSVDHR